MRALSFGSVAGNYDRYRPGYPREAIRWVLDAAPGRRALDLGAGTGKLTTVLVGEGADVVAVEPDPAMLAQLIAAVPGAQARQGSAEAIPADAAAFDAVLAAQAFHWFDPTRALPEIARVLAPDGVFAALWNLRDEDVPWVAALSVILGDDMTDGSRVVQEPDMGGIAALAKASAFDRFEAATFPYAQDLDEAALVALIATRSKVVLMKDAERAALLARVRDLCREHPEPAGRDRFAMPYVTRAFRVRRSSLPSSSPR